MIKVFTVGVFDIFHIGHLNLIKRASLCGDYLIVAVQRNVLKYKPKANVLYSLKERKEIISSLKYVNEVIDYEDVDEIIAKVDFDVFVKGPDQNHKGFMRAIEYCKKNNKKIVVLSRTNGISSTRLREFIRCFD